MEIKEYDAKIVICPTCEGKGRVNYHELQRDEDIHTCGVCKGEGRIMRYKIRCFETLDKFTFQELKYPTLNTCVSVTLKKSKG